MPIKSNVSNALARARVLRQSIPLAVGGLCLWLVMQQLEPTSLHSVPHALRSVPLQNWSAALLATGISFWALGRYDVIFHRQFDTGIRARPAALSGASAIAVAQVLGMGVVTGALVRWRILPGLSAFDASKIAAAVAVSFLICLAGLLGGAALAWGTHLIPIWAAIALILVFMGAIACSLMQPMLQIMGRQISLPSVRAVMRMLLLSAIDTAAAATALYVLLPNGATVDWPLLYTVYLLALSGALLSGTPGGAGPFELVLILALPMMSEPDLLGAIIGFRLIYYALPTVAALFLLALPIRDAAQDQRFKLSPVCPHKLAQSKRSELGVCRQNQAQILPAGNAQLAVVQSAQTLSALFDPMGPPSRGMFRHLAHTARQKNRFALFYKCSARSAALGRREGWRTIHIADEAVLNPQVFSLEGRPYRQLRRKLTQARSAGVDVSGKGPLPLRDMADIDAQWQNQQGPARGTSMGQFCHRYIADQQVYIARQGNVIVGYISFHISTSELCLDLMRTRADAPSGTMHLLVYHAIKQAAAAGRTRMSLAAMPRQVETISPAWARTFAKVGPSQGLSQFKTAFAPKREPLYALAPNWFALIFGLADMALAIRFAPMPRPHDHHEEKEFARLRQT